MKKRKVLVISFNAYSLFDRNNKTVRGGAELISYQIAKYLDKEIFEVHFIVGNFSQPREEFVDDIILHKGMKIKNSGLIQGFKNFIKLLLTIKKINPDVIFSSSVGWITVELILIKIILRKKYVFRSSHKRNIDGYVDQRDYGWLYRKLINKIDHFILQNYEDVFILKKNYNFKGKVDVIRNFQSIPKEAPLPILERNIIFWVGRSEKIKKPELFLDLAEKLPEYKFIMIMPNTNSEITENIQRKAREINNLEIIDGVSREIIMDYYKKTKYFVSTSQGEGFPNVLVEAMKYGTPIVSFFLDYDNILKKNNCGFIGNGNIDQVVRFIKNTSVEKWKMFSENCFNLAKENFDVKKGIKQYEDILLQL